MDATAAAPVPATAGDEATLLAEALDVPVSAVRVFSREPLGAGSVTGVTLAPEAASAQGFPSDSVAYLDTSLLPVVRETGLALDGVARVWLHPADPHLPALAPAAFGDAAAVLLSRLGIAATDTPELVGYRPGRRAVLRVPTEGGSSWVKVVRPSRIERVVTAHDALRAGGLPVPAVRGWSPEGLLVLDAATGAPATEATWRPAHLLDAVDDLRRRLTGIPLAWPARTSLAQRLPWYLSRLELLLPDAERLRGIGARIAQSLASAPAPPATIHGDLHIGQLFLVDGAVSGLIDVDTAGRGEPGEDTAAFLGHAVASALLTERRGGQDGPGGDHPGDGSAAVRALAGLAFERWGADARTRALTAVHLLGHALGAASAGDPGRAAQLIDGAERAAAPDHKSPLMPGFEAP
ncbi:phosphotransferase [Microbacterium sp. T2.11-28]|uniref:phosphotransferase n=1 Tax=Microbacterium sp. T2.11-28 TaxID=3041169 RepID=UPI00247786E5|nr:phosphotransferase [Microbacterium sp. T2.11-28]CAI9393602.1 hypothetical protein MICABA_02503 [Microbacterium sp. T2.11-28]